MTALSATFRTPDTMTAPPTLARVSTVEQLTENQRGRGEQAGYTIPDQRFIEEKVSGSVPASQRKGFQEGL